MVDFKDESKDKSSLLDHVTELVVKDKRFRDSTDLHSELPKIHEIAKVNLTLTCNIFNIATIQSFRDYRTRSNYPNILITRTSCLVILISL